MRKLQYSEKLLEEYIKMYPTHFIGEDLSFLSQQQRIEKWRSDLIFIDGNSLPVIIELQIGKLDSEHIYKLLKYRDLLCLYNNHKKARTLIVCNEGNDAYNPILSKHQIELCVISIEDFVDKVRQLDPLIQVCYRKDSIQDRRKTEPATATVTIRSVLTQLSKSKRNNSTIDAYVIWLPQASYYLYHNSLSLQLFDSSINLAAMDFSDSVYFNDFNSYKRYSNRTIELPCQIVMAAPPLRNLSFNNLRTLKNWIQLLLTEIEYNKDCCDIELILGWRSYGADIYHYEDYIRNRIKKFAPIWNEYREDETYNVGSINRDLRNLQDLILYADQYPNFSEAILCSNFSVETGAGSLWKNFPYTRKEVEAVSIDSSDRIQYLHKFYLLDMLKKEWVTVHFKDVSRSYLETMDVILEHLLTYHYTNRAEREHLPDHPLSLNQKCEHCLIAPKHIRNISDEALKLSSQYFAHFRKLQ